MLEVRNLSVSHGSIRAVRDLSLAVGEGEVVALLGANGAGKSSTLNAIVGLKACAAGQVRFDGVDITKHSTERIVRAGLTLTPEGRHVFPDLTVGENLMLGAVAGAGRIDVAACRAEMLELFPILDDRIDQLAGTLSGGEQQQLAIARSLMSSPKLLMLDEPSLGLAPQVTTRILALIGELKERGLTVLLVEQNVSHALEVADRAYILHQGEVALAGPASELRSSDEAQSIYLGRPVSSA